MKIIVAVMALLIATSASAGTLNSKIAARKLTDQVMTKVTAGDIDGGFMLMKPYTIIPESEFNVAIEQTKLQLPLMQGRFGKTVGMEFIREKSVGNSLLQIVQIQKFEKHVMRWNFIFYSAEDKWILNSFNFDDKIYSLFED